MRRALLLSALLLSGCAGVRAPERAPTLTPQASGTTALLIAAHAVSDDVAWVAGTAGTVLRTTDGGATWQRVGVPGADTLQFRDVHAFDARTAVVMSIGNGPSSRIYRTADGGASWTLAFENPEPDAFYDCLAFWDERHGLAFSDAAGTTFPILTTADGGRSWQRVPAEALPPAAPGEGSFAASGTCVAAVDGQTAWIGTGNAAPARLLRTPDRGRTWTATVLPLVAGEARGAASVAARDGRHGVALGGDIASPAAYADNVARTADGGATWTLGARPPFPGAVYGGAYVPGSTALVAVGPGGAALSLDDAASWALLDGQTFWGLAFASVRAGWLVGPEGRIVKVAFE